MNRPITWLAALTLALLGSPASAQMIHIPPAHRLPLPNGEPLMRVQLLSPSANSEARATRVTGATVTSLGGNHGGEDASNAAEPAPAAKIYVMNDHLLLLFGGETDGPVELSGRTIGDVVADLNKRYGGRLLATSEYRGYPASLLEPMDRPTELTSEELALSAVGGGPELHIGLGLVMSLAEADEQESTLIRNAGFQLDLVGNQQLRAARPTSTYRGVARFAENFFGPAIFAQLRLGLSIDEKVSAHREGAREIPADTASTAMISLEPVTPGLAQDAVGVLEQADQIGLTGQLEGQWSVAPGTALSLAFGYGVTFVRLERLELADLIDDEALKLVDAARLPRIGRQLNRTLPVNSWEVTAILRFPAAGRIAFYGGVGRGEREIIQRGISIPSGWSPGQPLEPIVSARGKMERYWRAVWGASVAGFADVRVDALGPIGDRTSEPQLRVVLARAFPQIRG